VSPAEVIFDVVTAGILLQKTLTMKARNFLRKIMPVALVLALIIIVASSCRKSDTEYIPVSPGPAPGQVTPDVFPDHQLKIMSEDEIARQRPFPGSIVHRMGRGMAGGDDPLDPLSDVGGMLWGIYNYEWTVNEFQMLNDDYNNLTGQIDSLNVDVQNLAVALNISFDDLTTFIASVDIGAEIANVQTAMGPGEANTFLAYSQVAAEWEKNPANPGLIQQMNTCKASVNAYATAVYNGTNAGINLPVTIQTMCNYLNVPIGNTASGGLMAYTNSLIAKCQGKVHNSADAMNAYRILENYFMTVINYQFQAATIMVNACNVLDTTGVYDSSYMHGQFKKNITDEVNTFLTTVDYLVSNINDYRDSARFISDMQYANAGLAPDTVFIHVLARSQFLANLLYHVFGLPVPVMCGHILTPSKYGGNTTTPLVLNVYGKTISAVAQSYASVLPYTYWDANRTCHPDNNWYVYRYGTLGIPDQKWLTTKQQTFITNPPWVSHCPIYGYVTPLWYNPENPKQTSTDSTSTCFIEFAYFSAIWRWGTLLITHEVGLYQKVPPYFDFSTFNYYLLGQNSPDNKIAIPFVGYTNSNNNVTSQTGTSSFFQNPLSNAGYMTMSGNTTTTKYYNVVADGNYTLLNTGPEAVPPGQALDLQHWGCYSVSYGAGNASTFITVNIGTDYTHGKCYSNINPFESPWNINSIGSDVVRDTWTNCANNTKSGFGISKTKLVASTAYTPGVQYYYQSQDCASVNPDITIEACCQFVYSGYFPQPN
jgi:hypothetical protein